MDKNTDPKATKLTSKSPQDKLDELNAELRNQPAAFRRAIEADLEAKSKRRRRSEPSTSSSFKNQA